MANERRKMGCLPWQGTWQKLKGERERKLGELLRRLNLDVLVGLSSAAGGEQGTVRFLANYATLSQSSCVLWACGEPSQLLVPYSVLRYDAAAMSWVDDIQVDADYAAATFRYLKKCGRTRGKVGWVGPPLLVQSVRSQLEALCPRMESVSLQTPFSEMVASKTAEETRLVRRSAAIADEVLQRVAGVMRAGVTDREIVAEAEYLARRLGSEGSSMAFARGAAMASPVLRDEPLEHGDVLQLSVEVQGPGGLWVQTVRMYSLGEPPQELAQDVATFLEAERHGAMLLREGAQSADVARGMLAVLGQPEATLAGRLGHGIGLDAVEPLRIATESPSTLRAGMTVALHPNMAGERSAVFLGDTFLVGEDGSERLTGCPPGLVIV